MRDRVYPRSNSIMLFLLWCHFSTRISFRGTREFHVRRLQWAKIADIHRINSRHTSFKISGSVASVKIWWTSRKWIRRQWCCFLSRPLSWRLPLKFSLGLQFCSFYHPEALSLSHSKTPWAGSNYVTRLQKCAWDVRLVESQKLCSSLWSRGHDFTLFWVTR